MNEQLLSLTHTGEEPEKYLHSVTPAGISQFSSCL